MTSEDDFDDLLSESDDRRKAARENPPETAEEPPAAYIELRNKAQAPGASDPYAICVEGEAVFYFPDDHARDPGHIYSELGVAEFRISKCCEYHFDKWFKEPEDEPAEGNPGYGPEDADLENWPEGLKTDEQMAAERESDEKSD